MNSLKPKQKKRLVHSIFSAITKNASLHDHKDLLQKLSKNKLLYAALPHLLMNLLEKYLRLQLEGIELLPKNRPALIVANHSGYAGFDATILSHQIFKNQNRVPRILTHRLWFISQAFNTLLYRFGFIEASFENGLKELNKNNLVVIFPEGEHGNFKPSTKAYQLQEFKRGFVRMALATGAPIVPTIIIGAEETHINLKKIKVGNLALPLPLNILPLPAKWKIKFLHPIQLPHSPEAVHNRELVCEIAEDIQEKIQAALKNEINQRTSKS